MRILLAKTLRPQPQVSIQRQRTPFLLPLVLLKHRSKVCALQPRVFRYELNPRELQHSYTDRIKSSRSSTGGILQLQSWTGPIFWSNRASPIFVCSNTLFEGREKKDRLWIELKFELWSNVKGKKMTKLSSC